MNDMRAFGDVGQEAVLDALRGGFAVTAYDCHEVLMNVYRDRDADFLLGEAPLSGLSVPLGQVRVVDVRLIDPDAVTQHDAILVAVDGGEDAVTPLEGRLVRDPADRGDGLYGNVPAHELHEGGPCGEVLLAVLEYRPGKGAEPPAALRAPEPLVASRGASVLAGPGIAAGRALGRRPVRGGCLIEGADADPLAAPPRVDGTFELGEVIVGKSGDAGCEPIAFLVHDPSSRSLRWRQGSP